MCVNLTDSHTEGQDDWWLLPTSWTGETLSADNEAKEKGLPFIWLYTLTTHSDQEHCTGDSFKLCLHQRTVRALSLTKSVTTEFKGTFLYAPACFHIIMTASESFWCRNFLICNKVTIVSTLSNYIWNCIFQHCHSYLKCMHYITNEAYFLVSCRFPSQSASE